MSTKPRLMVIGHAQHGKDTVCELLRDNHGYTFISSSMAALDAAIWPAMSNYYRSQIECVEDRHNWRALWFELIKRYNAEDPTRLAQFIYSRADIYCGIRSETEFNAVAQAQMFDFCIWVDAGVRLRSESGNSMELNPSMADFMIMNDGPEEQLPGEVSRVIETLERVTTKQKQVKT